MQLFPCGRCVPCLVKRRETWTHRIMLEAGLRKDNTFVTLTLDDKNLEYWSSSSKPTLDPDQPTLWLKRFRKALEPDRVRYVLVGEYGGRNERPHYHAAIFGFPTCRRKRTMRVVGTSRPDWKRCCPSCCLVGETWGLGDVDLGMVEVQSARYLGGYILKGWTRSDDLRLGGRYPEFVRRSLKPGIGADALWEISSVLLRYPALDRMVDVPAALDHGTKSMPLGRYLRRKLRTYLGRPEDCPDEVLQEVAQAMLSLFASSKESGGSIKAQHVLETAQAALNFESRLELFRKAKSYDPK